VTELVLLGIEQKILLPAAKLVLVIVVTENDNDEAVFDIH